MLNLHFINNKILSIIQNFFVHFSSLFAFREVTCIKRHLAAKAQEESSNCQNIYFAFQKIQILDEKDQKCCSFIF